MKSQKKQFTISKLWHRLAELLHNRFSLASAGIGGILLWATILTATASITFEFADKGQNFGKYIGYISTLLHEGKQEEARQTSQKLIDAYRLHCQNVRKSAKKKRPNSSERVITRNQNILELVHANVLYTTGQLPWEQWKAVYERRLSGTPRETSQMIMRIANYPKNILTGRMCRYLMSSRIPLDTKQRLLRRLFVRELPRNTPVDAIWERFYKRMLTREAEVDDKVYYLNLYTMALQKRNEQAGLQRALESLIQLNPNTELGLQATVLRAAQEIQESKRDQLLIEIMEQHADTQLPIVLQDSYIVALARQGRYDRVLSIMDGQHQLLEASDTTRPDVVKKIADRICLLHPLDFNEINTFWSVESSPRGFSLRPQRIQADLATHYLKRNDYTTSISLSCEAMTDLDSFPLDLQTGQPIQDVSRRFDTKDPQRLAPVATFLAARAQCLAGNLQLSENLYQTLTAEEAPRFLRPYGFFGRAVIALSKGDTKQAVELAEEAQALLPGSPVLHTFLNVHRLQIPPQKRDE